MKTTIIATTIGSRWISKHHSLCNTKEEVERILPQFDGIVIK